MFVCGGGMREEPQRPQQFHTHTSETQAKRTESNIIIEITQIFTQIICQLDVGTEALSG